MRRFAAIQILLCICVLFTACGTESQTLAPAIEFRAALVQAGGCTFRAEVRADFGETVAFFCMDCDAEADGILRLTLTAPETLAGITATVTDAGGKVTYDGMALDFGLMAGGNVIPAAAPALAVDCWIREYIASAGQEEERYRVTYEKDFDEKKLVVDTWYENGVPICAEVCYNDQRILKLLISDFTLK